MTDTRYALSNGDALETPALVFYREIIEANTRRAIELAGAPGRLWPHIKTHKMREMIEMQRRMGITRFKCATVAEAQLAVESGAEHVLLAYPQVGPTIGRYLALQKAYPGCAYYAIGDDETQLQKLSDASLAAGLRTKTLLDVNIGMNRTGVGSGEAEALFRRCSGMQGLEMVGLHCYDGHVHDPDLGERTAHAQEGIAQAHALRESIRAQGYRCELLVMGGTPTFPIHALYEDVYLSPGTVFLSDAKCQRDAADLGIIPAAGVWTRVVSHPAEGLFALDLGSKGISTDQADGRGIIAGLRAAPLFQSEEHWVYQAAPGEPAPAIGTMLFVIPMHICPTVALYPHALVASGGMIVDRWAVAARNRHIGF